ncbi:cytochrome p450 26a1-like isoform 2 [Lynx pardinus]|uniref:Cytochrome P450 26A1 n=1 Tax=Lynx pardinus TaxID=191816 RepID=A0A485MZL1_LYNPA|nr:cytochrome p450 26a1-like isoform 2 [Lynx pardinus]
MFPWGLSCLSVLGAAGTALLCAGLLLSLAQHLWTLRWTLSRDRASALPLPKGSMGWPFFGETLHWLVQGSRFHSSRRERYGTVFKTHLLGRPVIRVSGAENVRTILLGEHRLVRSQWPQSAHILLGSHTLIGSVGEPHRQRRKVLARAFSRAALQRFVPRLQGVLRREVRSWCAARRPVAVYQASKALTFRMAARILLGLRLDEAQCAELARTFEQFVENLFSLPLDVPFSGLRKARNLIHARIEENIRAKICGLRAAEAEAEAGGGCKDALQLLIEHSWERGERLDMQALKQSSTELLFGGHETTASAATSLITYLGLYPHVLQKVREELKSKGLLCKSNQDNKLDMEILGQLKYIGCVIKETLRLNPPVPGGFRVALKTFELNGYQIPKGWNVIYSICDTHDVADIFTNKEEFNPDRFMLPHPEDASRFSFIPFGGGLRSCVGKEFAKILLKIFTVELARHCDWRLLNGPPTMKTSPTVYPVDDLPARFTRFQGET